MILYDYLDSGNGYKIRLLLAQLGSTRCPSRHLGSDRATLLANDHAR